MFFYFCLTTVVAVQQTAFSAAASDIADGYKVSTVDVTMCSIVFSITYIPMTFVAIWMFREFTPTTNFRVTIFVLLVGAWMRTFAGMNFSIILAGYTIISCTFPFFLSSVTLICNSWLGPSEKMMWV